MDTHAKSVRHMDSYMSTSGYTKDTTECPHSFPSLLETPHIPRKRVKLSNETMYHGYQQNSVPSLTAPTVTMDLDNMEYYSASERHQGVENDNLVPETEMADSPFNETPRSSNYPDSTSIGATPNFHDERPEPVHALNYEVCLGMIDASVIDLQKPRKNERRISVSLKFDGEVVFLHIEPKGYSGFLELRTGKCLSRLNKRYAVHFDAFMVKKNSKHCDSSDSDMVHILVYGLQEELEYIGDLLSEDEVYLQHPEFWDTSVEYDNPHYFSQPGKEIQIPEDTGLGVVGPQKSLAQLVDEVSDIFEGAGIPSSYSEVSVSERLKTKLKDHQRMALAMMIEKESGKFHNNQFGQLWAINTSSGGSLRFRNVITGSEQRNKPQICLGGLLADAMGLGKTLTALALIAGSVSSLDAQLFDTDAPTATLIVTPLTTLLSWQEQINHHFYDNTFRVHVYHGDQRSCDLAALSPKPDVVLTTYDTLNADFKAQEKTKKLPCPLHKVKWLRIILDEAHFVKDRRTQRFKAVCALEGVHRWCLTGTPIQNRIDDFAALLAFLRVHPFNEASTFKKHILEPLKRGEPSSIQRLRSLVNAVSLRRTKASVLSELRLERRTDRTVSINFTKDERKLYDFTKCQTAALFQELYEGPNSGQRYTSILQAILCLRQLCAHYTDLLPSKLRSRLQSSFEFMQSQTSSLFDDEKNCEACGKELVQEEFISGLTCLHIICSKCTNPSECRKPSKPKDGAACPLCVLSLSEDVSSESQGTTPSPSAHPGNYVPSSKVKALLRNLQERVSNPEDIPPKSVVFSSWTKMLDLVGRALDAENIRFKRIDGTMNLRQKETALQAFRNDTDFSVLLASIKCAGVGIDLTAASRVHLLEPQWNKTSEEQALDRVHRMGQAQHVITYRYIMKDSIEEYVTALQEKKLQLISLSFGSDATAQAKERLKELEAVLQ